VAYGVSSHALLARAAAGDAEAWESLVERHVGLLWSTARGYGLSNSDAADAVQVAWLRLVEHVDHIRDPDRVGAWLATTVRRECLNRLRQTRREQVSDTGHDIAEQVDADSDVEAHVLRAECRAELVHALQLLPPRQRLLLRLLSSIPTPTYEEVSAALNMPIGSIGPTRARALRRLREMLEPTDVVP